VLPFGEQPRTGPVRLPLCVLGVLLVLAGIVVVDRPPTAQRVARRERREHQDRRSADDAERCATAR
jgi:hypothetical protein